MIREGFLWVMMAGLHMMVKVKSAVARDRAVIVMSKIMDM
jgi:hypothetical protein